MRWALPITSHSQSLFFQPNGESLHCLDELQSIIFSGLKAEYKISELCEHLANDSDVDCYEYIEKLRKHWTDSGLLGESAYKRPVEYTYQAYYSIGQGTVAIQTDSQASFESINQVLFACESPESEPDHIIELVTRDGSDIDIVLDGLLKHSCQSLDQLVIACLYEIGELATHEFPRLFVAHAAAVRNKDHVLLMPGYAGQGKSTLVAGLIKRGYQLINDDIVPVNFDGTLVAINAPLKIKSGSWEVLESLYPEIATTRSLHRVDNQVMKLIRTPDLCCQAGSSHRATALILPQYLPNSSPKLTKLEAGDGLQSLLLAKPYLPYRLTRPYLKAIVAWQAELPVWRVRYQHTDEAAELLASLPVI